MGSSLGAAIFAASLVSICLSLPAAARADVGVALDCFLEDGPVDCHTVRSAYFASFGRVVRPARGAGHRLTLRSTGLASRTQYVATVGGLRIAEVVPNALDGAAALGRVVALLQRATLPLVPLRSPVQTDHGALRLETADGTARADPESSGEGSAYIRPSLGGEIFEQGISVVAARASIEASSSGDAGRLLATAQASYRHVRLEVPGNDAVEGSTFGGGVDLVAARTIAGGLSTAFLTGGGRAPANNLEASGRAKLGIEWVRVPLRRAHENNVGLRYRIGAVGQRYVTPNVLGDDATLFPEHGLTAFTMLHTGMADVTGSLGANAILDRPSFWDVNGSLEAAFPLTDALELSLSASVRYRARAIHEPRDPDGLDTIAVLASGSDFVPFSYGAELSLSYAFGNALLYAHDQRWRSI